MVQKKPEVKKIPDPDQNNPAYAEYFALNDYQRRVLDTNNYWAVMSGEKPIAVPPSDKLYHKYFDNRCYDLRKRMELAIQKEKEKRKLNPEETPVAVTPATPVTVIASKFCECKIAQKDRKYKKMGSVWHCFHCEREFAPDSLYGSQPSAISPAEKGHTPSQKDPKFCDAHAPMPNGRGGFKCGRCGTELVSKTPAKKPASPPATPTKPAEKKKQQEAPTLF